LKKCGLNSFKDLRVEEAKERDKQMVKFVYISLIFIVLIFPTIFILRHSPKVLTLSLDRQLKTYVLDYNYYIAFYSIAISLVNLTLIILSAINVKRQKRLWKLKTKS